MIDKLLRRIASRKATPSRPPLSVIAVGSHGEPSSLSSAGCHDPFSTSYPAPGRIRSARSGQTVPGSQNAWALASEAYIKMRSSGGRIADQPAYFAGWSVPHMAVAQILWAEHDRLHLGEATVHSGDKLLAVIHPKKLSVRMNAEVYQNNAPLSLHQLPLGQSVKLPDQQAYASYPMYSLLWFYGQVYSHAPDLLPPELGLQLIQLRRFPPVEPAALEMRHLALIHIFSGGALSFTQLQQQIAPELAHNLCADLASLYFTGTLRLLP
ncbi:hypothetical protein [Variovorax sp. PCZ-1]|uniref:hypothetical protein n=1 Tax=Variovorax sp. PCZ-1 TaxID=2835533 RepID=UPI001BCF2804|nr:hypothetical protein [Variovorax sp. PCZ-1]MBS7806253.1 hypothetical protein [Variovorax sp. PCZ-1]